MALTCLLAFWTGGDAHRMDRLFRRSGLMREKWYAVHYADGSTYGETTIERACNVTTEYYSPSDDQQREQTQSDSDDGESQSVVDSADEVASTVDIAPVEDGNTVYEREKARIETITTLERQLRDLEAENDRLQEERDAERAKRKELETKVDSAEKPPSSGIIGRVKQLFL